MRPTLTALLLRRFNVQPFTHYRLRSRQCTGFQCRRLHSSIVSPNDCAVYPRSAAPLESYDSLTSLYDDPYQRAVMKHLNKLWHLLKESQTRHIQDETATDDNSKGAQSAVTTSGQDEDTLRSIYIHGSVGTGKTMVMDIFYNTLPTPRKKRIHYHELMLDVHAQIHALRSSTATSKKHPMSQIADDLASSARVLCLDEFQVTDIADAMLLRQLVDELLDRGVVIVTTSNRHPSSLYDNGHHRILFYPCIRRIMNDFNVLSLDGGVDYRRANKMFEEAEHSTDTFLHPLNDATRQRIDEHLRTLTGNKLMTPLTVTFLDRTLRIPAHVDGIGAARFSDLCSDALSAADYLALVRNLHTLILTDIPAVMERVEARRFITLIDALYESHTRLYASADCAVEELFFRPDPESEEMLMMGQRSSLFTGEEEAFALKRALSRLIEMQSKQWLAQEPVDTIHAVA